MSTDAPQNHFKLRVLIVGAGPCGLATAISVTLAGHSATVFEATDGPQPFGAGILSSPNGTRLLSRWGLNKILGSMRITPKILRVLDLNGDLIAEKKQFDTDVMRTCGSPLCTYHRADLQAGLLRRALEMGVEVHFSSKVSNVNIHEHSVKLQKGDSHCGDLVVIADGTWSTLRSKVLGRIIQPRMTDNVAYRVTIDLTKIDGQEVSEPMKSAQLHIWRGTDAHVTGYHVRDGSLFTLSIVMADDFTSETSSMHAIIEELKTRLCESDKILAALLKAVQRVNKWRLVEVSGLSCLDLPKGFVLAGDTYHTLRPSLSQGFNLGLEDAATLGSLLGHVKAVEQIPGAIAMYERLRSRRVQQVLHATQRYESGGLSTEIEPRTPKTPENSNVSAMNEDIGYVAAQNDIWAYDAYEAAETAYYDDPY
ncbi:hypothetical protein PFICI_06107 [Pestalotiopsis fici W106-1]|uniref:FAD-binding domain-containing protein n=1 Tax=Pestalotiopsis fici (strain W106-1 / CGMCC3.15140) TaxID=1229662 RepID=W3X4X0_PESFW|nr:uncharacterized protein PFICI_06107 [Pestalotiopsis fici W106-1]ETS81105.1 hypothetical protein PFICI_06107 [Pestalotiopsis fici W106-1]